MATVFATICAGETKEESNIQEIKHVDETQTDADLKGISYTEIKDGVKEWVLTADSGSYFENEGYVSLVQIHMTFYRKDGKRIILTGERAKLDTVTKDIEVNGNVVVIPDEGYRLKTDSLKYCASKRYIHTQDRVYMTGQDVTVEGRGMEFHVDSKRVIILEDVKTIIRGS